MVIYRTHADRLHDDLFKFLGDASDAYLKYFTRELKATTSRCGLDVPLSTLGPGVIIFHETVHTKLLGSGQIKLIHDRNTTSEEYHEQNCAFPKIIELFPPSICLSLCLQTSRLNQLSVCFRSVSGSWVCFQRLSAPSSTVELGPTTLPQTSVVFCVACSSSWITTPPAPRALPVSSTRLYR